MHYDYIIDCGKGDAVRLSTNSPTKVLLTVDIAMHFAVESVNLNYAQSRRLISCLQGWIDDNPDHEACEINEDSVADNTLNGD